MGIAVTSDYLRRVIQPAASHNNHATQHTVAYLTNDAKLTLLFQHTDIPMLK